MNALATDRSFLVRLFTPDHVRYEGVRPFHIHALRILYVLMFVGVGIPVWTDLFNEQIPADHSRAVAFCAYAAYTTLGLLGLRFPLRMLPIILFMLLYKSLWLLFYAYPLWAAGQLWTSPAAEMAKVFRSIVFLLPFLPWGYVWRQYVTGATTKAG